MPLLNAAGRQLLDTLQNNLIPWASSEAPFVLLSAPPQSIGSNSIIEQPGKKLPTLQGRGQRVRVQVWRDENLNSMTKPYMGCVVEGEADIITGTTTAMCRKLKIPGRRWILNAPAKSFFMTPPQIPVSWGSRPHWEQPAPEKAYSRILWMQFHTTGVNCHFCTSDRGKHWTHPYHFIYGTEFFPLAQNLIHEMTAQPPQYLFLVYHHLSTLLHYMVRGLLSKPVEDGLEAVAAALPARIDATDDLVNQAISFIDLNLNERDLSVEKIATHLHLSSRHLARIFQRDTGQSVIAFVIQRRMKLACQLLIHSQFNIAKIAGYSGYVSSSSFVKTFLRHFGVSPTAYRLAHQSDVRNEQWAAVSDSEKRQKRG